MARKEKSYPLIDDLPTKETLATGARLREVRQYYGLYQEEFAKRIKITQSTVALLENGRRFLRDIYIKLICDTFDISEEWLQYGVGKMIKQKEDRITIEEYSERYDLTPTERDVVLNFLELSERAKQESLETFIRSIKKARKEIRLEIAK
jgi:transcriptional regulator with XRE-family HTH domain